MATAISTLPQWLQTGDFVQNLIENDDEREEPIIIPKHLKLDSGFSGLIDVFEFLDTCLYLGVDKLPSFLYDYCANTPGLIEQMRIVEQDSNFVYQYFITTPEYQACRLCACKNNSNHTLLGMAIVEQNMPCIRYCIEDFHQPATIEHFRLALVHGHIHICRYLLTHYPIWLKSIQYSWSLYTIVAEYEPHNIDMLIYLHKEVGVIWKSCVITTALIHYNIEFVEYAIKNGCPVPQYAVDYAIRANSMTILQLLLEKGLRMDSSFSLNVAIHLELLEIAKFLYNHGARPNNYSSYCTGKRVEEIIRELTK